jgi:hypothetical protein
MKKSTAATALFVAAAAFFGAQSASGAPVTITQYSFSGSSPTPSGTQTATTGIGTATELGMANSYTYANGEGPGSLDGSNITTTAGTANPSFSESTWRIVGNSNAKNAGPGKADGWNNSAPDYTQGAEFGANTSGFVPTLLTFDWYSTTQGVGNLQVRYTLDGSTFQNIGSDLVATSNDYFGAAAGSPTNTVDLSSISAAATNDPNFAIELVSVRPVPGDANYFLLGGVGPGQDGNYASAASTAAAPTDYNNNSGNWRFDNVTISGTAVPEPASAAVFTLVGLTVLRRRRRN